MKAMPLISSLTRGWNWTRQYLSYSDECLQLVFKNENIVLLLWQMLLITFLSRLFIMIYLTWLLELCSTCTSRTYGTIHLFATYNSLICYSIENLAYVIVFNWFLEQIICKERFRTCLSTLSLVNRCLLNHNFGW